MKWELLSEDRQERSFVLVFDAGNEVISELKAFADHAGITAAHFTAIGAFSEVTLAYFDWEKRSYREIPVNEQVEALSISGDIAMKDGLPHVHAHAIVGLADGTTRGGHLVKAWVRPTLELILTESARYLQRAYDPKAGIALINLDAIPGRAKRREAG